MDPSPHRILVLDDDADLRALLQRYLGQQGLHVRTLEHAAQLERLLAREPFDALVLDLMMPGEDGLAVLRRLRAQGETIPVLMLTARGDPVDRIVGLEMGADDYLAKPFDPRELLARVQALLRRQHMLGAPTAAERGQQHLEFGGFRLDFAARRLLRGDGEVELTSGEYALLAALARQPGRALGRERLLELAHGRDHDGSERSVDVRVLRLRRLIEPDPAAPRFIRTVWGVGYVFTPDGASA
jgi:two-component system phosphate regulon response regulator OmpR